MKAAGWVWRWSREAGSVHSGAQQQTACCCRPSAGNAAVVSGAEQYYRNMFFGDEVGRICI